jgi:hypothetical protein
METAQQAPAPGSLSWKLSSHPITLLTFLFFRICTSSLQPNHNLQASLPCQQHNTTAPQHTPTFPANT